TPAPIPDNQLVEERAALTGELQRLTEALAAGGNLPTLLAAIQDREKRRSAIDRRLAAHRERGVGTSAPTVIEQELLAQLADWRTMLGEEVAWTRQIVQKLLVEKATFVPVTLPNGEPGYELRARFHFRRLFSTFLEGNGCPLGVASPTGEAT